MTPATITARAQAPRRTREGRSHPHVQQRTDADVYAGIVRAWWSMHRAHHEHLMRTYLVRPGFADEVWDRDDVDPKDVLKVCARIITFEDFRLREYATQTATGTALTEALDPHRGWWHPLTNTPSLGSTSGNSCSCPSSCAASAPLMTRHRSSTAGSPSVPCEGACEQFPPDVATALAPNPDVSYQRAPPYRASDRAGRAQTAAWRGAALPQHSHRIQVMSTHDTPRRRPAVIRRASEKQHGLDDVVEVQETTSLKEVRGLIARGLRPHRHAIEQAIHARVRRAVPHRTEEDNPDYEAGLQKAIMAIVDYSLEAIEKGPEWAEPIPPDAAAQARRAARVGVDLGTIHRRYFVGHREFGEFVTQELERVGLLSDGEVVNHLRTTQEALLEHLAAVIEHEYNHEQESIGGSRRPEIVQRLLSGEPVEPTELADLDYEIDTYWHLGLIASGPGIEDIVRTLRGRYRCKLLRVSRNSRVCVWLGMRQAPTFDGENLSTTGHPELSLAIGEPGKGFDGWRLTHHQARSCLCSSSAQIRESRMVRRCSTARSRTAK